MMSDARESITFPRFCDRTIRNRLPGEQAQKRMAPVPNNRPAVKDVKELETQHSAVMIICALSDPVSLLYTLRPRSLANHGGQISFPGGRQENGESLLNTAQRETAEEVGIPPDHYEVVGCLSPLFVPVSRYIIHPWLAFCDPRPEIRIRPMEVSEAFWVQLDDLLDEQKVKTREQILRNNKYKIPFWDIHSVVPLWGATAMITSEIVTLYRDFLNHKDRTSRCPPE